MTRQRLGRFFTTAVLACGILAALAPLTGAVAASTNVTLGGMDLDRYCWSKGYHGVRLAGNNAGNWYCQNSSGGNVNIAVNDACRWQYGIDNATGNYGDWNDPYSWRCYANVDAPASKRLNVVFETQIGSAGDPRSGSANCGPASIAMVIETYRGQGTISVADAAMAIRNENDSGNKDTGFLPGDYDADNTASLLNRYRLQIAPVSSFEQMEAQIAIARSPVLVLVDNNQYRSSGPYSSDDYGWFTPLHIVVVTGYNQNTVYINDPLRGSGDFAIPSGDFQAAADANNWHAAAIVQK